MKVFYGRKEGVLSYYTDDTDVVVFSTLDVPDDQDMSDVMDYLRTVVGQPIPSVPAFSWSYDTTYRTQKGRDYMRALLLVPAKVEEVEVEVEAASEAAEEEVACSCGHTVSAGQVMSTSTGSSCPECYDEMSCQTNTNREGIMFDPTKFVATDEHNKMTEHDSMAEAVKAAGAGDTITHDGADYDEYGDLVSF